MTRRQQLDHIAEELKQIAKGLIEDHAAHSECIIYAIRTMEEIYAFRDKLAACGLADSATEKP